MDECIYEARHGFEAQLLADLLGEAGLRVSILGADLLGAAGELPALGLVQLRVPAAQVGPARELIRRWQAGEFALGDAEGD